MSALWVSRWSCIRCDCWASRLEADFGYNTARSFNFMRKKHLLRFFHKENFATSVGAMVAHFGNHYTRKGYNYVSAIVKIGVVNRGSSAGAFRPEEHSFNFNTGKMFFGSDANLHSILFPDGVKVGDLLKCRHCDSFEIEFCDKFTNQMKAKRVASFVNHELNCNA